MTSLAPTLGGVAVLRNPLIKNAWNIMLTAVVMGGLGFLFWVLAARLLDAKQVGVATTLITATTLISHLSLLGLNTSFLHFLPTAKRRDEEISTGLVLTFFAAIAIAGLYVMVVPSISPRLHILSNPWTGLLFVVLTAFSAVNLLTDSLFIALRAAHYNVLVSGVFQGGAKLLLPFALGGLGAYGLFVAVGGAAALAFGLSVALLWRRFGYRGGLKVHSASVRRSFNYSASNYVSNLGNILPMLVLPVIVLNASGEQPAAHYFVAFQVATFAYTAVYAVSQSLLVEGSYGESELRVLGSRSAKVLAFVSVLAGAGLVLVGPFILRLFGGDYRVEGFSALALFGLATPAVALNNWTGSMLRIRVRLTAVVISNGVFAVLTCGLAVYWANRGIAWVASSWLVGNVGGGVVGLAMMLLPGRRQALTAG